MNRPARRAGDRLTGAPTAVRCLRLDFGAGPEMVVAEGFENALAVSLVGHARVVAVGAVGAYGRCRLPRTVETITLAHDGDDPDAKPAAAQAYHRGVVRYLGQGLTLRMTAPPTGCDPNDVLKRGGPDALKKLLTEARCDLGKVDDAAFLDEVCKLDDLAYDRARATALKLLGLGKLETLDKLRAATRKRWAETPGSTEIPPVPDDDQPWLEPVTDIGPVLDAALAELARYVIAPPHRLATAVLWSAYVHLLPRADLGIDVAPRLGIRSKVRGSGKSTLLECVENLTPNPVLAGSITPSSIFRIIDATRATLLIDEADNIVNKNSSPDLLAILNSGHRRRTAYVIRSVPTADGGWVPAKFNTFTGIAFAGLEILPETLQDRSLGLPLHKATREEKPEHLANGYSPVLIECRRKFARWAADLHGAAGRDPAARAVQSNRRQLARPVQHCGSGRGRMAGTRQAGGDGGDQRGGQQPHPAAAGSHLADLRREEGRAHAHEGPAGRPEENRGGAMGGGEQRPRDRRRTGCGKSSRASCRGPQIPKRRRRSAVPANGGRGKALPLKGYTEDHLREAWRRYLDRKTPTETRQSGRRRSGPAANGGGDLRRTSRPRPSQGEAGLAADGADKNGAKDPASGERRPQRTTDRRSGGPARARRSRRGGMIQDQLSPTRSALAHFKVRPSYATDAATATALVAEIITDAGEGLIAVDFETTPLPSERARLADLTRRVAEAKGKVQACAERRAAARRGQTTRRRRRPRSRSPRRSWRRSRRPSTTPSGPVSIRTVRRRGSASSTAAAPASP